MLRTRKLLQVLAVLMIALPSVVKAQTAAEMYAEVPGFPNPACACIKNADGKCMDIARGPYPYRQFDEGISGPHCVTGCFPGFSDVYGYSTHIQKEMIGCTIDWKRLRHALGRDHFAGWQW